MNEKQIQTESYYDQRNQQLHAQWSRLSNQATYAGILLFIGGVLFVANLFGVEEPPNNTLGGLTLGATIVGAIWLWLIKKEQNNISREQVYLYERKKEWETNDQATPQIENERADRSPPVDRFNWP